MPTRQFSECLNARLHAGQANIHTELSHSRLHLLNSHPRFYPVGLFILKQSALGKTSVKLKQSQI